MPIKFQVKPLEGYFVSKWFGTILNNEILSSYKKFFENDEWIPELNELADFSQVDMSKIHNFVLMNLSKYAEDIYNKPVRSNLFYLREGKETIVNSVFQVEDLIKNLS